MTSLGMVGLGDRLGMYEALRSYVMLPSILSTKSRG